MMRLTTALAGVLILTFVPAVEADPIDSLVELCGTLIDMPHWNPAYLPQNEAPVFDPTMCLDPKPHLPPCSDPGEARVEEIVDVAEPAPRLE